MTTRERQLSIAVLAYDEAENLPAVLGELHTWLEQHEVDAEIILVDDGSKDDTAFVARALMREGDQVVRHDENLGMGAGLKSAARVARGTWLTFLPADGQVPPSAIGELLRPTENRDLDLVLSVYERRDDGATRALLSWGVRALITVVHGVRLRSDGPYLIRRRLFEPDQLEAQTFFLNFELPIRALAAGLRHEVVTVQCRPRRAGRSKTARPGRALGVGAELVALRVRQLTGAIRRLR